MCLCQSSCCLLRPELEGPSPSLVSNVSVHRLPAPMGSRILLRGATLLYPASMTRSLVLNHRSFSKLHFTYFNKGRQGCTSSTRHFSVLQPPDVSNLAETARISLTSNEVEEFEPKIRQVIDWFGQLQNVDLQNVEPSIRADTEDSNLREDIPEAFDKRDVMIAAVPSYEEPYIKVPKVLIKE